MGAWLERSWELGGERGWRELGWERGWELACELSWEHGWERGWERGWDWLGGWLVVGWPWGSPEPRDPGQGKVMRLFGEPEPTHLSRRNPLIHSGLKTRH